MVTTQIILACAYIRLLYISLQEQDSIMHSGSITWPVHFGWRTPSQVTMFHVSQPVTHTASHVAPVQLEAPRLMVAPLAQHACLPAGEDEGGGQEGKHRGEAPHLHPAALFLCRCICQPSFLRPLVGLPHCIRNSLLPVVYDGGNVNESVPEKCK